MADSTKVTIHDVNGVRDRRGEPVAPDEPYCDDGLEGIRASLWAHKPGSVVRRLMATIDQLQANQR